MKTLDWLCITLMIIGSVNWGLVGFFNFDLVTSVFGGALYWIARIIFALVGLAGIYSLTLYGRLDSHEESKQV